MLVVSGRVSTGAIDIPGLSFSVPTNVGIWLLVVFSVVMGWIEAVQLVHAARLLHAAEFRENVPPQRIRLALTGTSLASSSPTLVMLMNTAAAVSLAGIAVRAEGLWSTSIPAVGALIYAVSIFTQFNYPFDQTLRGLWLTQMAFRVDTSTPPGFEPELFHEAMLRAFRREGTLRVAWWMWRDSPELERRVRQDFMGLLEQGRQRSETLDTSSDWEHGSESRAL
jgi:hypothetical protein